MSLEPNIGIPDGSEKLKMAGGKSLRVNRRRSPKLEELVSSLSRAYNETVGQALEQHEYNFVLSDPRLPDHPIVYASEGFLRMSGYDRAEVLGRNCRFLQGRDTDRRTVLEIRDAIREERPCQVRMLNYTKQGRPFWNFFHMAPIYSKQDGSVIHFVGVQTPIVSDLASEAPCQTQLCVSSTVTKLVEGSITARQEAGGGLPLPIETPVDMRLRGGATEAKEEDEEEDDDNLTCTVTELIKEKAALAMRLVTCELTHSSRVKGALVQSRQVGLSESAANGVVCSSLMISLTRIQQSFVLADPNLPDMPIVHASEAFCELTGYTREEVVGRNCRFLQGPETNPNDVEKIREAVKGEQCCTVRILNYRKDKKAFWNHLHLAPVRSAGGKVAFYVGVQLDITEADVDLNQETGMSAQAKQLGAVGVVRVAVRSLQGRGLRRTLKGI
uniref:Putative LOV domain-containing protein n=1 Tax=Diphyscium foliosum TaxID=82928 RepID=A0A126WVE6_DIPFO|nr:putative LOV domain-containing protein [Diphyscium foliosum]